MQATPQLIFGTFTAPRTGREDKGGGSSRDLNAVNTEKLEVLAVARRLGVSSHNTVKRIIPNAKALQSKPYHVPLNMTSRGMVRAKGPGRSGEAQKGCVCGAKKKPVFLDMPA